MIKKLREEDILASVTFLRELKKYVGEEIPPSKICLMSNERLNALYNTYQAKLAQELTFDTTDAFVGTAVEGLTCFLTFDDDEALKQDLLKNKPLRQVLERHAAGVAEKYGDFVAFGKVIVDIVKHIKLQVSEAPGEKNEVPRHAGTTLEKKKKN